MTYAQRTFLIVLSAILNSMSLIGLIHLLPKIQAFLAYSNILCLLFLALLWRSKA